MRLIYTYFTAFLLFLFLASSGIGQTNLLTNGDIETITPNFWEKMGGDAEMTWAEAADTTFNNRRSFKISKTSTTAAAMGWKSVNNADLYWNNAGSGAYTLKFKAKTDGVNTAPANDDAKIGVMFRFLASGVELGSKLVAVDQSTAATNWAEYPEALILSSEPDEVYAELIMGKDATGTVWFDNIDCNTSDAWTMGIFNGDAEIPQGWLNWASEGDVGFANFVADTGAYSGDYSALLEENDTNGDEMVFYSTPVPAEPDKWYKFSVWAKTEGVNTGDDMVASNPIPDVDQFLQERLGVCFFFHVAPINTSWTTTGGDRFMYFTQQTGHENEGWTQYNVISQAPDNAAGVSMRARFNPKAMGKVWYDDFSIQPINVIISALETPQNSVTLTPSDYKLGNNYPNPFNPETIIEYVVPAKGQVKILIYNMLGQKIRTLVNTFQSAGTYQVYWNGKNDAGSTLSSGVYFYQLQGENALITKKMTFIK
jgi:hypothetical protein